MGENKRKIVYVCSRYKGNVRKNVRKAIAYCRAVYNEGHIPIAPHLYLTRFLDDNDHDERIEGMNLGLEAMTHCDELWVFGSDASEGMLNEIEFAKTKNIPVKYIKDPKLDWMIRRDR